MSLRETSTAFRLFIRLLELAVSALFGFFQSCLAGLSGIIGLQRGNRLVVLTYHSISDDQKAKFASQMDRLLQAGQAVFADAGGPAATGGRCIAVTFDDGYQSILRNAIPALHERGIPSVIFMTTKYMGQRPGWILDTGNPNREQPLISGEQLQSLQNGLVRIGSHTHSHTQLGRLDRETLREELLLSKRTLEHLLSREVDLLSLPYGSMDRDTLRCSRAAGYRTLFLNVPFPDAVQEDVRIIGRTHVSAEDWAMEYHLKLRGAYDWIAVTYGLKKKIKSLSPMVYR
jgi:peptidoglycan/xylan/chitin deacetylase (PgdA/CDA1 family)